MNRRTNSSTIKTGIDIDKVVNDLLDRPVNAGGGFDEAEFVAL